MPTDIIELDLKGVPLDVWAALADIRAAGQLRGLSLVRECSDIWYLEGCSDNDERLICGVIHGGLFLPATHRRRPELQMANRWSPTSNPAQVAGIIAHGRIGLEPPDAEAGGTQWRARVKRAGKWLACDGATLHEAVLRTYVAGWVGTVLSEAMLA